MDNSILRKKISTFKSSKGSLIKVSDEVIFEVIRAWEQWSGRSTELAKELGINVKQLIFLIKKAKQLKREGVFPEEGFKEIKVEGVSALPGALAGCGIELSWGENKLIRFSQVEQLVDFLKKVA